jgi:hypothetical protein
VLAECGWKCVYCDRDLSSSYESWLDFAVDHVVPVNTVRLLGYPADWVGDLINLATCCQACNGFLSRYALADPAPKTLSEFCELRDRVYRNKRERALKRHETERARFAQVEKPEHRMDSLASEAARLAADPADTKEAADVASETAAIKPPA